MALLDTQLHTQTHTRAKKATKKQQQQQKQQKSKYDLQSLRVAAHRPRNFYRLVAKHDSATFFICRATLLY